MWQAGRQPHSSDFILWTWTLHQVPSALVLMLLVTHRTGIRRYGGVTFVPLASKTLTQQSSLERERFGYDCSLSSLKRNRCVPGHISFVHVSDLLRLLS